MKLNRVLAFGTTAALLLSSIQYGYAANGEQKVDSGSFGVFMRGQRVATETFSVEQNPNGSVTNSDFKSDQGAEKAQQSSELQLTPTGDLRRYEWRETSPGKTHAVVTPGEDMVTERITTGSQDKAEEKPFYLPASINILDDYFFIQREVLLWRFLAAACRQETGPMKCPGQKTTFGTLNPHARTSSPVDISYVGPEKVTIRGAERELNKFTLTSDSGDWSIWTDDHFKVIRILISSDSTEVVRD